MGLVPPQVHTSPPTHDKNISESNQLIPNSHLGYGMSGCVSHTGEHNVGEYLASLSLPNPLSTGVPNLYRSVAY